MAFTQDFFTSRRNQGDGETYVHQVGRLWYDSNTNTIRIGDGTPGGIIVSSATGGGIETDPVFVASPAFNITNTDITNWDTAHGWGDHSIVGYALTADINLEGGTLNQVLVKQSGTDNDYVWEDLITYEPKYTKEIDDVSVQRTMYLGEAPPDSLVANAVWRISEIIFDNNGNVDSVRWASGSNGFTFVWNDRLTYTYS